LPRQAVVLLPFIEEARLLEAVAPLEASLTSEEAARNGRRVDQLFVSTAHPLAPEAFEVAEKAVGRATEELHDVAAPMDPAVRQAWLRPRPPQAPSSDGRRGLRARDIAKHELTPLGATPLMRQPEHLCRFEMHSQASSHSLG